MPFFRTLLRPLARQPWWPRPGTGTELGALLDSADASAPLVERHLWLIRVIDWVRCGEPHSGTAYVMRLLAQDPARRARVVALLAAFWRDMDVAALLADYGFSPRSAFLNELGERLRRRALPPSPDTADLAQLFNLLFDDPTDVDWVSALDASLLADLAQLWREALAHELACGSGPGTTSASPLGWREPSMPWPTWPRRCAPQGSRPPSAAAWAPGWTTRWPATAPLPNPAAGRLFAN
jgi:hypothetical protein